MARQRKAPAARPAPRHVLPAGCAVCGRPSRPPHQRTFDDAVYAFCSAECARLFDESPRDHAYEPRPPRP
ncbi:MAG TPA: hypothetical protein VGB42_02265 [Candidatus Thermoplasmatota archaeon]